MYLCSIFVKKKFTQIFLFIFSSSDTSPQATPGGGGKFGFKETVNVGYKDTEDDSPPPPTLPPRNYRASNRTGSHSNSSSMSGSGMERRPLPPLPQKQVSPQTPHQTSMVQKQISSTVTSYTSGGSGDLTQDYDSTPKADYYADQLRAQARRLSQNQPTMLNAARYQSKALPEMKTNIIKSRPVDGQPRPQEARPISAASATSSGGSVHSPTSPQELSPQSSSAQLPPTLYRTSEFDRGLNFIGITTENGAQSSSSDSLLSPSSSSLVNSSPSPLSAQDFNANHRNKNDSLSSSDNTTQITSPGRHHQDYPSDHHMTSPVVRERLLGNMVTPDLPPPPTPVTGDNTSVALMDETFTPPPLPSPLGGALDEQRKRRSVDDENTPNRYVVLLFPFQHNCGDMGSQKSNVGFTFLYFIRVQQRPKIFLS